MNIFAYVYVLYEFISNPTLSMYDPISNILFLDVAYLKAMWITLTTDLKW